MRQTATVQRIAPIWEPSTVLPSQLGFSNGRAHRPELHLVSAIFEDALHCVMHHGSARRGRKRREFLAACDWFWNEDSHWPFAFTNICDLLAIDGAAVRTTLRAHIVAQRSAAEAQAARHWSRRALRRPADAPPMSPRQLYETTMWDEV